MVLCMISQVVSQHQKVSILVPGAALPGPAGPVLAGPLFGRIIYSYSQPQLKMRGVATLDILCMRGACVQYSALSNAGARQVRAPHVLYSYTDDVMVMNIIKTVKFRGTLCAPYIWPDQLKNASAVPVY